MWRFFRHTKHPNSFACWVVTIIQQKKIPGDCWSMGSSQNLSKLTIPESIILGVIKTSKTTINSSKDPFVMQSVVSIRLPIWVYEFFVRRYSFLLDKPDWSPPVFAGFILGTFFCDLTHYTTHHVCMKKGYLKTVRQQPIHHHFQTPDQGFGVTSPVWDFVFYTMPGRRKPVLTKKNALWLLISEGHLCVR